MMRQVALAGLLLTLLGASGQAPESIRPALRHISSAAAGLDITLPAGLTVCDTDYFADGVVSGTVSLYLTAPRHVCDNSGIEADVADRLPHIELSFGSQDLSEVNVVADRRICHPLATLRLAGHPTPLRACERRDGLLSVEAATIYDGPHGDAGLWPWTVGVALITPEARLERDLPILRKIAAGIRECGGGIEKTCEGK